jgi:hypothetical protein
MSFRGAWATRYPNDDSLLKIYPFGRNDKNGGYSWASAASPICEIPNLQESKGDETGRKQHGILPRPVQ